MKFEELCLVLDSLCLHTLMELDEKIIDKKKNNYKKIDILTRFRIFIENFMLLVLKGNLVKLRDLCTLCFTYKIIIKLLYAT